MEMRFYIPATSDNATDDPVKVCTMIDILVDSNKYKKTLTCIEYVKQLGWTDLDQIVNDTIFKWQAFTFLQLAGHC